jgi:sec-independent protein translocase protein TatA
MQTGPVTDLGWPELLIVAVIAMMLFGSKKMPEIARSLGRSMRIVKSELRGLHDDDTPAAAQPAAAQPAAPATAAPATAAPAPTTAPQPPAVRPLAVRPLAVQPVTVEPLAPVQPIAPVQPVHATPDHPTR